MDYYGSSKTLQQYFHNVPLYKFTSTVNYKPWIFIEQLFKLERLTGRLPSRQMGLEIHGLENTVALLEYCLSRRKDIDKRSLRANDSNSNFHCVSAIQLASPYSEETTTDENGKQQQWVVGVIFALDKYLCLCIDQRKDKRLAASCLRSDGLLAQVPCETNSVAGAKHWFKEVRWIHCPAVLLPTGDRKTVHFSKMLISPNCIGSNL